MKKFLPIALAVLGISLLVIGLSFLGVSDALAQNGCMSHHLLGSICPSYWETVWTVETIQTPACVNLQDNPFGLTDKWRMYQGYVYKNTDTGVESPGWYDGYLTRDRAVRDYIGPTFSDNYVEAWVCQ